MSDLSENGVDGSMAVDLREVFDFLDRDQNGMICANEIGYLVELLKLEHKEDTLHEMIAEVDSDNDGSVSFDEFVKVICGTQPMNYTNEDVQRAFRMFADAGAPRGSISKAALKAAIITHCPKEELEEIDVDRLVAQFGDSLEPWVHYKKKIDRHIPK